MQIIYVLRSKRDGNLYIGCTADLEQRLKLHTSGQVQATKYRLPIELIYHEEYQDKYEAFRMERFYKTAPGKHILKNKIRG